MDSHTITEIYEMHISRAAIKDVLEKFYDRAFDDLMISHFFLGRDKSNLIEKQLTFTIGLLGGPKTYTGKPLPVAHFPLQIRRPHFMRRRVLMHECMLEAGLTEAQAQYWLTKEHSLQHAILSHTSSAIK